MFIWVRFLNEKTWKWRTLSPVNQSNEYFYVLCGSVYGEADRCVPE